VPLLLLLAFAILLSGCRGFSTGGGVPESEPGPSSGTKQTIPAHSVLRDGASGQLHQGTDKIHEIHILAITDAAQSSIEHEKPGNDRKYWSARIGIKNAGESELRTGTWALAGSDGVTYPRTVVLGIGSDYQDHVLIQSGATIEGTIAFEIPKDVSPKQLQYRVDHLSEMSLYFDVQ
jgi:hypothetical protein